MNLTPQGHSKSFPVAQVSEGEARPRLPDGELPSNRWVPPYYSPSLSALLTVSLVHHSEGLSVVVPPLPAGEFPDLADQVGMTTHIL